MAAQLIGSRGKENTKSNADEFLSERPRLIIRLKLPPKMRNLPLESNVTKNPPVGGCATNLIRHEDKERKVLAEKNIQESKVGTSFAVDQGHRPKRPVNVEVEKHQSKFEASKKKSNVNSVMKNRVAGSTTCLNMIEQKEKRREIVSETKIRGESKGVVELQGRRVPKSDMGDLLKSDKALKKTGYVDSITTTYRVFSSTPRCLIGREDKGRRLVEGMKTHEELKGAKQGHVGPKTVLNEKEYSSKFEASKRKLEDQYRAIQESRKRICLIDIKDLPKQGSCTTNNKRCRRRL